MRLLLETTHVHLIAVPDNKGSFAEAIGTTHSQYAMAFNERYKTQGHLWHSRFFSCVLDEVHFWNAIRYVELNPVRAGLVARAQDYPWSSARVHCGYIESSILSGQLILTRPNAEWSTWLEQGNASGVDDELRRQTLSGLPYGTADFVRSLEVEVGRPLTRRKPGPRGR